jgi:hypothetical protein
MTELSWKDAIEKVLNEEEKSLHYTRIAELIVQKGYRTSLGATPQNTVNRELSTRGNSIFERVDEGVYTLKKHREEINEESEAEKVAIVNTEVQTIKKKIINAYGIYWNRSLVHWEPTIPDLLGIQLKGAQEVNFKDQKGIYLLHDSRETIYVGQAIEQTLGKRLKDHRTDRLAGRWDRFSWFGFYPVKDDGRLNLETQFNDFTLQTFGDVVEAVLIESIEPRQNRKQGNSFVGLEFLQQEAPEIKKNRLLNDLREFL